MNDQLPAKVRNALPQLIERFIPDDGSDESFEERRAEAYEWAKDVFLKTGLIHDNDIGDGDEVADVIRERLQQRNALDAVKFSNLLNRLHIQPLLQRKLSLVNTLYLLSDLENGQKDGVREDSAARRPAHGANPPVFNEERASQNQKSSTTVNGQKSTHTYRNRQKQDHRIDSLGGMNSATSAPIADADGIIDREQQHSGSVPKESDILRELPFVMQGLSSTNLKFESSSKLTLPSALPLPMISILNTLAEPSLLYRQLSEFCQSDDVGLIRQSLKAAISAQLRDYLGLISSLEGSIRRSLEEAENTGQVAERRKASITLKKCVIGTQDATMGLRLMSLMVEESKSKMGGRLISMIHGFSSSHGDPFVGAFAESILSQVTRPFYDILQHWIYEGELSDPYHEFFVREQEPRDMAPQHPDPRRAPAINVWEDKYTFVESMIPTIVTPEVANKVFLIGKSLSFIRHSCNDSAWVEAYRKSSSQSMEYTSSSNSALSTSIDAAYKSTMSRLTHLMNTKFNLSTHLLALKKYLLLNQGDFIALLMESLAPNLDAPARNQYRHTLTAQLEHAIRGSNAQYESEDVLRRLDARLVELSQGDVGWDVFTLEYKVDSPVDVIITPWAGKQYLIIFNLLWRVKRVEFSLSSCWRRAMTGARGVLSPTTPSGTNPDLALAWKAARGVIAQMIHFVNQLQYYFLFEVIEKSWSALQTALSKPDATLDEMISAHATYLTSITRKGLLGKNAATSNREESFTAQLHEILKLMLEYRNVVEGLYSFSVAEFSKQQSRAARIESRTAAGKWGTSDALEDAHRNSPSPFQSSVQNPILASLPGGFNATTTTTTTIQSDKSSSATTAAAASLTDEESMLSALRTRMSDLSSDFRKRVEVLLGDLLVQPDGDMKFLGVVMNFNDTYAPRRRRRRGGGAGEEKKTPGGAMAATTGGDGVVVADGKGHGHGREGTKG